MQDIFSFIYNVHEKMRVKRDYPDLNHNVDNFKVGVKVAIKFQINLQNFKTTKKIDTIKTYFFRLVEVYLIDEPNKKPISILKK